ncbi:MAG TPA: DegT/DnrJ/EryC1/StrS family aminotransferase [Bacteroidales bacterium]|nr:DegT/DnrJ/EryC1/StrS family aminotransferase [Bacteroidales bacterium]
MKELRMVDLKGQYDRIKSEIDSAIQSVLDSSAFIKGPEVEKFEEELASYLGVKHVISCANGTDALQLALMALDLEPGDEVITSDFTFIATAEVIALLGLKPVFVDPETDTFNISASEIEKAITPKTRVIMPVHLFGQSADMEEILKIARKHKLYIIEDAAQATGAEYLFPDGTGKKAGTIGDIGCTSFFPSKNLSCYGDGGAVFTDNDEHAKKIRSIANHGSTKKYYHDDIGINSRLDAIQAAVLRVKLKYLDEYNITRRKAASFYDRQLSVTDKLIPPYRSHKSTHIFHQYTIMLNPEIRDLVKEYLATKNIPSMVYYPVPMHKQKAYAHLGIKDSDCPLTTSLCTSVLSLPMHTELVIEQLQYITDNICTFLEDK